jgi:hypothetical protein
VLFESTANKNLTGFAIWVPQLGGKAQDVPNAASIAADPRIQHFWDGANDLGESYEIVLPTPGPAWDVYMLYGPGATWSGQKPPKPDFWMHQLGKNCTAAPTLDPDQFASHARELLKKTQSF